MDELTIECIKELCATDPDVVAKARRLDIYLRQPKVVYVHRYKSGRWTRVQGKSLGSQRHPPPGSRDKPKVWLNRDSDCETTKSTIYHEVRHSDQPASMSQPDKEMDAYVKTEQWTIERGLQGQAGSYFRKRDSDGNLMVNEDHIREHVQEGYGYNVPASGPTPPQVVDQDAGGSSVKLSDGSTRPVKEGDAYKKVPPQDLHEKLIPPNKLTCP